MPAWVDRLIDFMWPRLTGPLEPLPEDAAALGIDDEEVLVATEQAIEKRLTDADERTKSIDSRLLPLLALTSIVSALLTAAVPIAVSGTFDKIAIEEFIPILVVVLFIAVQLLRSLQWSVDGLRRRAFGNLGPDTLTPLVGESAHDYRVRLLGGRWSAVWQNEWANNRKSDAMELAHISLQNALSGGIVLALVAVAIALIHRLH